jgi:hypothetical protein
VVSTRFYARSLALGTQFIGHRSLLFQNATWNNSGRCASL